MPSNKIDSFEKLKYLNKIPSLKTVYFNGNPVTLFPSYREEIIVNCPQIEMIDHFSRVTEYKIVYEETK